MLLGEYEHTIDEKNRLTLPAKFRSAFAQGIVVTRGMDGCLYAYARPNWESYVQSRLAPLDPLSQEGRRMQRFFFAGANDHVEIWDRAAWREELREVEGSAHDVAERLAAKRD
jgi:MraZ protein